MPFTDQDLDSAIHITEIAGRLVPCAGCHGILPGEV
jgi:hypothetical protein